MKFIWDFQNLIEFGDRLTDSYELETHLMTATKTIAQVLHKYLLQNTPVDTGNLRKMWSAGDNLAFTVEKVNGGFEVTLVNTAINKRNSEEGFMYGVAVNDGHSTPSGGWVMGRFFVERSIAQSELKVEQLIMKELSEWFGWCVNG